MFRRLTHALVALTLVAGTAAAPAFAAPCRDVKTGKFVKCPPKAPTKCRDAKGRFAKCETPGARPA